MKKLLCLLLGLSLLFGCSDQSSPSLEDNTSLMGNWGADKETLEMEEELLQMDGYVNSLKIIKTGAIRIEVENFEKSRIELDSLIKTYKGFVANEVASRPNDLMESRITVKVMPEQFYSFMNSLSPMAIKVHDKSIQTKDVTEEYTDLEARLKAREDVANRYKEILKEAKSVDEILTVEAKLQNVLEEIESAKGRIRYFNNQVGLSTVTVTMFQYLAVADIAEAGFFNKLGHAFTFGWNDILDVLIGLASNWHLILFLGTILFFGNRWRKGQGIVWSGKRAIEPSENA